jgi:hypothetical protein
LASIQASEIIARTRAKKAKPPKRALEENEEIAILFL